MIVKAELLAEIIKELKGHGQKVVFTNGCFDILHAGHVFYLDAAKKQGDFLIIGLNSDDSVARLKGPDRPLNRWKDRAVVLDTLRPVDFVTGFSEDTPYELIKLLKPDVLIKGGDYRIEDIVGAGLVKKEGGSVLTIPFVEGRSTTALVNKIKSL
ncbi:MAG: D-glycero-beta-D-manno-heptose 1-phosphate adenylyltransferase [Candidatus Kapaibacterium sp.]